MRPLAFLCLLTACSTQAPPPPQVRAPDEAETAELGDGLDLTLALARTCVGSAPHQGLGHDGSPLELERYMALRDLGEGRWEVSFTEAEPTSEDYGRTVVIDPLARTCDDDQVIAAGGDPGPSLRGLWAAGWACASAQAEGKGVMGTALSTEGMLLSIGRGGQLHLTVPEVGPAGMPSGWDVSLGTDGTGCAPLLMD